MWKSKLIEYPHFGTLRKNSCWTDTHKTEKVMELNLSYRSKGCRLNAELVEHILKDTSREWNPPQN